MPTLNVVGLAVARQKGYYPTSSGHLASVPQGSTFEVVEGHPVDDWADAVQAVKTEEPAPPAPAETEVKKPGGKAKSKAPPPVGDIA